MSAVLAAPPGPGAMESATAIDWGQPPHTTPECLRRIEALEERIHEHVRFIHGISVVAGVSEEVKQKALTGFYERLLMLDRTLRRLGDDLRLA